MYVVTEGRSALQCTAWGIATQFCVVGLRFLTARDLETDLVRNLRRWDDAGRLPSPGDNNRSRSARPPVTSKSGGLLFFRCGGSRRDGYFFA